MWNTVCCYFLYFFMALWTEWQFVALPRVLDMSRMYWRSLCTCWVVSRRTCCYFYFSCADFYFSFIWDDQVWCLLFQILCLTSLNAFNIYFTMTTYDSNKYFIILCKGHVVMTWLEATAGENFEVWPCRVVLNFIRFCNSIIFNTTWSFVLTFGCSAIINSWLILLWHNWSYHLSPRPSEEFWRPSQPSV